MIIKIPNRNKTVSGIAPQIVNYHCHMVVYPPFSKAQRQYQYKSVEGFEPPNSEVAAHSLKPLGYTLNMNDLISLYFIGKPLLVNHFL